MSITNRVCSLWWHHWHVNVLIVLCAGQLLLPCLRLVVQLECYFNDQFVYCLFTNHQYTTLPVCYQSAAVKLMSCLSWTRPALWTNQTSSTSRTSCQISSPILISTVERFELVLSPTRITPNRGSTSTATTPGTL